VRGDERGERGGTGHQLGDGGGLFGNWRGGMRGEDREGRGEGGDGEERRSRSKERESKAKKGKDPIGLSSKSRLEKRDLFCPRARG